MREYPPPPPPPRFPSPTRPLHATWRLPSMRAYSPPLTRQRARALYISQVHKTDDNDGGGGGGGANGQQTTADGISVSEAKEAFSSRRGPGTDFKPARQQRVRGREGRSGRRRGEGTAVPLTADSRPVRRACFFFGFLCALRGSFQDFSLGQCCLVCTCVCIMVRCDFLLCCVCCLCSYHIWWFITYFRVLFDSFFSFSLFWLFLFTTFFYNTVRVVRVLCGVCNLGREDALKGFARF